MKLRAKKLLALAMAGVMTLSLAGCGGSGSSGGSGNAGSEAAGQTGEASSEGGAFAREGLRQKLLKSLLN